MYSIITYIPFFTYFTQEDIYPYIRLFSQKAYQKRNETVRTALRVIFIGHFFLSVWVLNRTPRKRVCTSHTYSHVIRTYIYVTFTRANQIEFRTNAGTRDVLSFTHKEQGGTRTYSICDIYIQTKVRERISYTR